MTVNNQILLVRLNHHGIRGVSNYWFKPDSGFAVINCSIPQGFILGLLLLLLYVNDLNQAIKFCKVDHYSDDNNLLCVSNSVQKPNKLVNADLKHLLN